MPIVDRGVKLHVEPHSRLNVCDSICRGDRKYFQGKWHGGFAAGASLTYRGRA
jgi:hypothetical protein